MPILGIMASSMQGAVGNFESISTVNVGVAGSATITFSSIPSTYKHLQIRFLAATTRLIYGFDAMNLQMNGDTGANYAYHRVEGNGSTAGAAGVASANNILLGDRTIGAAMPNVYGTGVLDILDYANTSKYKTTRNLNGVDNNGTYDGTYFPYIALASGLWQSTSAITSLTFTPNNGIFKQYSSFALYGIK